MGKEAIILHWYCKLKYGWRYNIEKTFVMLTLCFSGEWDSGNLGFGRKVSKVQ